MINTPQTSGNPGNHYIGKFYKLTPELAKELRALNMTASAWRLWSYLATFDPFGDEYIELPELWEILAECNIGKTSFYKAIALFSEHNLFDLQASKLYILNLRGQKIVRKRGIDSANAECQFENAESQFANAESSKSETPTTKEFQGLPNVPTEVKNNKKEQTGSCSSFNKGLDEEIFDTIKNAGVNPSKTIRETVASLIDNHSAAAAIAIVENAVSALREQQSIGKVRNASGFLLAALRGSYTANEAKVKARENPPCLQTISYSIDLAIQSGDRGFALDKLRQLWADGYHNDVKLWLVVHKNWGISKNDLVDPHDLLTVEPTPSSKGMSSATSAPVTD